MPARNNLKDGLSQTKEIEISVVGRKSGRTITNPVWFVMDGTNLYLLPVEGSDTQWYKNVLKNPSIRIEAGGAAGEFKAVAIRDSARVSSLADKFREKYGAKDVKKYYSKFDAAICIQIS
jgi:deazaflavin-dependent oxidoreductase (nitroreductase family)